MSELWQSTLFQICLDTLKKYLYYKNHIWKNARVIWRLPSYRYFIARRLMPEEHRNTLKERSVPASSLPIAASPISLVVVATVTVVVVVALVLLSLLFLFQVVVVNTNTIKPEV